MDNFMRSNMALVTGLVLYGIFEIAAVPVISALTVRQKISKTTRVTILLISFVLAVFTPFLVAVPLDVLYLHVSGKNLGLYYAVIATIMLALSFSVALYAELRMLRRLSDSQNEYHDQLEYFQSGSMVVFLVRCLLLLLTILCVVTLVSLYAMIDFPSQLRALSIVPVLVLLFGFPTVWMKANRKLMIVTAKEKKTAADQQ